MSEKKGLKIFEAVSFLGEQRMRDPGGEKEEGKAVVGYAEPRSHGPVKSFFTAQPSFLQGPEGVARFLLQSLPGELKQPTLSYRIRHLSDLILAGQPVIAPDQFIIQMVDLNRKGYDACIYTAPGSIQYITPEPVDNVKDHIVICGIEVVSMLFPVTGTGVNLHITRPEQGAGPDACMDIVGSCMDVPGSVMNDIQTFSAGGSELILPVEPVLPDEIKKLFPDHGY